MINRVRAMWGSRRLSAFSHAVLILTAGVVAGVWLFNTPDGLLGKADAVGYAVCHRIDLRSFHLGDRALPLCARCSGMYLGAMVGMMAFLGLGRGRAGLFPPVRISLVLGLFGLAFALDGVNSYLHFFPQAPHLYAPNNMLRLVTGTLVGLGLAVLVYTAINQSLWRDWRRSQVLRSWRDLLFLLALEGVMVVLVLLENPLLLYPLALLSSLGVLVLLSSVYAIALTMILGRENQAETWRQALAPLMGGLILAIGQLGAIDLLRFVLTGTWDGFNF